MSNLNRHQFSTADSTLPAPGMAEAISPAKPFEQTESQFHNRPDVMVHGRFVKHGRLNQPGLHNQLDIVDGPEGFHSGTERAAIDRVSQLGPPRQGYAEDPRFFFGHVDPKKMQNKPPGPDVHAPVRPEHEWRRPDQGMEWSPEEHDTFYENNFEDEGSTSAIHSIQNQGMAQVPGGVPGHEREVLVPRTFKTWRQSIDEAQAQGERIPSHVKAVYDATGGTAGPHHVINPAFYKESAALRSEGNDLPMIKASIGSTGIGWQIDPHASASGTWERL